MMLAIIEADPEGTGIQGMTAENANLFSGIFLPYSSKLAAEDGNAFKWIRDSEGNYVPAYFSDDLLPAFQMGRQLYESGVIEQDIAVTTIQSAAEKFLTGKSAAILLSGGFGGKYTLIGARWEEVHGTDYMDDVRALHLMPDVNGEPAYPVWGYAWSESYINANVDEEKLERILQLYDYLLSDGGAIYTSYGPEGDLYDLVEGKVILKDDTEIISQKYPSTEPFAILVRWNPNSYDDRFPVNIPREHEQVNHQICEEAQNVEIPEYFPECTQIMRREKISFSIDSQTDFMRIMTGTEPVELMWADILSEYEEKGLEEVIRVVNREMQADRTE